MTYAAIITHVQADPRAEPRLTCALDLARRFDATPIGVGAELVPLFSGFYGAAGEWSVSVRQAIERRIGQAHERFKAAVDPILRPGIWIEALEPPTEALATASRAADLIVAGGASREMRDTNRDVSTAALAIMAGRPVLVAPPRASQLRAHNIVVGWKDTREARRALTDALPFLEQADQVLVVEACTGGDVASARQRVADVASALQRRGVRARPKIAEKRYVTGFDLVAEARQIDADLIVCGAYGQSRLREWTFGGFTADLLSQDDVFVLMSH